MKTVTVPLWFWLVIFGLYLIGADDGWGAISALCAIGYGLLQQRSN